MNDKLFTFGKTRHLTCAWVSTGDAKTPLACVWVDSETSRTASSAQTASNDESGGDASVRLETGELQPRGLPGLRGRPPLRGEVAQLEDAPHLAGKHVRSASDASGVEGHQPSHRSKGGARRRRQNSWVPHATEIMEDDPLNEVDTGSPVRADLMIFFMGCSKSESDRIVRAATFTKRIG